MLLERTSRALRNRITKTQIFLVWTIYGSLRADSNLNSSKWSLKRDFLLKGGLCRSSFSVSHDFELFYLFRHSPPQCPREPINKPQKHVVDAVSELFVVRFRAFARHILGFRLKKGPECDFVDGKVRTCYFSFI